MQQQEQAATTVEQPRIGQWVPGYHIPVINERAVRVSAVLLFAFGMPLYLWSVLTADPMPMKPFGIFFILDMLLRVGGGERWSPTLQLSSWLVSRWEPQWVGAPQKQFAWWLGYGIALTSCAAMGALGAPLWVPFLLCGMCLTFIFLEAAFGFCVGCQLQRLVGKSETMYCPGGQCEHPRTDA